MPASLFFFLCEAITSHQRIISPLSIIIIVLWKVDVLCMYVYVMEGDPIGWIQVDNIRLIYEMTFFKKIMF